jgi:hypothetical protein
VGLEVGQRGRGGPVFVGGEVGQARGGAVGAQEPAAEPLVQAAEAVRVVELGGQHRGDAEGEQVATALGGQPSHDVEHGEVGVRPRLVEPLLPDRPPPVVGEPGEVGVQHEAERPHLTPSLRFRDGESPFLRRRVSDFGAVSLRSRRGESHVSPR